MTAPGTTRDSDLLHNEESAWPHEHSPAYAPILRVMDGMLEFGVLADLENLRVLYANRKIVEWLGQPAASFARASLDDLVSLDPPFDLASRIAFAGQRPDELGDVMTGELLLDNGKAVGVDVRLCPITLNERRLVAVLMQPRPAGVPENTGSDSTGVPPDRRDPLTGLADRSFLMSRLEQLLRRDVAPHQAYALLFIDLDNFKQVNDEYGHLRGDEVLREVADRLSSCLRAEDHIVRFGGDEFVVLVEGVANEEETRPIVDGIHAALKPPIALPGRQMELAVSIGVAMASPEHRTADDVLDDADRAMYASKRAARS